MTRLLVALALAVSLVAVPSVTTPSAAGAAGRAFRDGHGITVLTAEKIRVLWGGDPNRG